MNTSEFEVGDKLHLSYDLTKGWAGFGSDQMDATVFFVYSNGTYEMEIEIENRYHYFTISPEDQDFLVVTPVVDRDKLIRCLAAVVNHCPPGLARRLGSRKKKLLRDTALTALLLANKELPRRLRPTEINMYLDRLNDQWDPRGGSAAEQLDSAVCDITTMLAREILRTP